MMLGKLMLKKMPLRFCRLQLLAKHANLLVCVAVAPALLPAVILGGVGWLLRRVICKLTSSTCLCPLVLRVPPALPSSTTAVVIVVMVSSLCLCFFTHPLSLLLLLLVVVVVVVVVLLLLLFFLLQLLFAFALVLVLVLVLVGMLSMGALQSVFFFCPLPAMLVKIVVLRKVVKVSLTLVAPLLLLIMAMVVAIPVVMVVMVVVFDCEERIIRVASPCLLTGMRMAVMVMVVWERRRRRRRGHWWVSAVPVRPVPRLAVRFVLVASLGTSCLWLLVFCLMVLIGQRGCRRGGHWVLLVQLLPLLHELCLVQLELVRGLWPCWLHAVAHALAGETVWGFHSQSWVHCTRMLLVFPGRVSSVGFAWI